jgi:hypothetical protein
MAGSNYLDGAENQYGLPSPLPAGLGEQASAIVDSYVKRPEGLIYTSDLNGNPAFMRGLSPSFTYKSVGAISPGAAVAIPVTPPIVRPDLIGEVLVLDRKNPDALESVIVTGTTGNDTIIVAQVQFAHTAGTTMDVGMIITEERTVPSKRSIVRYSKFPCVGILSLMGRYGYGRRSDQVGGLYQEMNLLASVQTFGGPPQWIPITVAQANWSDQTGEIWVPAGMLLAYYSDVKIKYVAGFPEPPDNLVRATAAIAQSLGTVATMGGNAIKVLSAGDSRIQRIGATNMDDDTRRLLAPFMARTFY